MSGGQRWCVVETVADHEDAMPRRLERVDRGDLLRRLEPALPSSNAERGGDRSDRRRMVARHDAQIETAFGQRLYDRHRIGPQRLAHGEYRAAVPMGERDQGPAGLG